MYAYKLNENGSVLRVFDSTYIPPDPNNLDYVEYLAWTAAGNVADPYVEPPEQIAARQRKASFDADATRTDLLTRLRTATPAQINNYVDVNVTTLVEARTMFKRILLCISQV